ncbi:hypothetical protein HG536_0E05360 [Torulaspora globosa]|uniref:SCA7 domain-containing protein n=1 Tax=Torulaspora globosa TaxID=48254 RepID=A0A7G3ZJD9_9SACH|nr:uncharacterized protein HG536_0E05360 [Torulaspora globosa]QLL33625.1 hypothetical protein HG536_0E05360 [Torulaspora globosa]
MSSARSEIEGIKKQIQEKYSNVNGAGSQGSDGENGWKDLLQSVKNNVYQYKGINQASREKYFSANARILEDPLESSFQYRVCNNCGVPLALNSIMDHLENHCKGTAAESPREMKKELTDDDVGSISSNKRKNMESSVSSFDGKTYPVEAASPTPRPDQKRLKESSETPVKRQRKVKQRNPTEKHLIDFDKQCGVELPEGGYCARSLTCKSHSMGAKRSVVGRTQPFDMLLAEYHKQHQTKIGAAAEKRAKQQEIQKQQKQIQKEQKKQLQQQKQSQRGRKGNSTSAGNNSKTSSGGLSHLSDATGLNMNVTPEEETTQVLNGVSRSLPLPLESTVLSSVRSRNKYFRMREMFASAFSVRPGFTSPGYGAIHSRVGCLDLDRTTDYKFRIRTPQPMNQLPPQGMTPQQMKKLQQQRLLRAQLQQGNQLQQANYQQNQQPVPQQSNNVPKPVNGIVRPPQEQTALEQKGLTPQEIQFQQQKLRQQQLQQQRFEAAAFHLANATKLMQGPNGNPGSTEIHNNNSNSPPPAGTPSANQQIVSPMGGRVNVGIGNYGGRVN